MLNLDTNVLAEPLKAEPNDQVLGWLERQPSDELYSTVINQAETLYGLSLLPQGSRREQLQTRASQLFGEILRGRVAPLDSSGADRLKSPTLGSADISDGSSDRGDHCELRRYSRNQERR